MVKSCPERGSHSPGQSFNSIPSSFCALKYLLTCSWHFQEHATQPPKVPSIKTSLWWTATKQEVCSSCIPSLVKLRLSVMSKVQEGHGGFTEHNRQSRLTQCKKWNGTLQEAHGRAFLTSSIWWDRIKSSVEKGGLRNREVKSRCILHVWLPLWPTLSLS